MINEDSSSEQMPVDQLIQQQEFGIRLRETREAMGLSIRDVAEQLNLKEDVLNALESSQVDKLPAPTFTQGYIRSYARLLKLPADEILKAYNSSVPEKQHPLVPNYGMPIISSKKKSSFKAFLILFVIIMVVIIAYFINDSQLFTSFQSVDQSSKIEEKPLIAEDDLDKELVIQSDAAEYEMPDAMVNDQQLDSLKEPQPSAENTIPAIETLTPPEVSDTDSLPLEELQIPEKPVTQGDDMLEIVTASASWAEVQDVNGNRLIFELLDKGQTYQVKGMAPFSVFLGNAPSITILVNNFEVDFSGYIRKNNIAHITVDNKGLARFNRRDKMPVTLNDDSSQHDDSDAAGPFANDLQ